MYTLLELNWCAFHQDKLEGQKVQWVKVLSVLREKQLASSMVYSCEGERMRTDVCCLEIKWLDGVKRDGLIQVLGRYALQH